MNTNFKQSALKLALVSVLALGGVTSALANIGGSVAAINVLGASTFATAITVGTVDSLAANGRDDVQIVSGTINNNDPAGWTLSVKSANQGRLTKSGIGAAPGRQITYTSVKFVGAAADGTGTGLGSGLTVPSAAVNIATPAAATGISFKTTGTALSRK